MQKTIVLMLLIVLFLVNPLFSMPVPSISNIPQRSIPVHCGERAGQTGGGNPIAFFVGCFLLPPLLLMGIFGISAGIYVVADFMEHPIGYTD